MRLRGACAVIGGACAQGAARRSAGDSSKKMEAIPACRLKNMRGNGPSMVMSRRGRASSFLRSALRPEAHLEAARAVGNAHHHRPAALNLASCKKLLSGWPRQCRNARMLIIAHLRELMATKRKA